MKTLAIDTSGKSAGIAVLLDNGIMYETYLNTGQNHSLVLLPEIDKALNTLKLTLNDFDLFVATAGPGSFTGLRIGLSTLKGFALSLKKPLIGVSTLEALAHNICVENLLICPVMNGPMDEIYTALYRHHDTEGCAPILEDHVTSIPALIGHIREPVLFIGDGASRWRETLKEHLREWALFAPEHISFCRPSVIGCIGIRKYERQEIDDMVSLIPFYLRVSEAEMKNPSH
ncbi:MAG: tRNA (adenosine(37)-N6)-threonylcarbamoyltransferase complex dimerization subunit type 1 TsaB [Syntrophales bacterium]|jgi:tRNA threonylcarbamoyladenosine biosynthesis protein TsaB|nr:tRNA (adenosine(37)-N6)-threonylcarbamoyltransferase complex dimerization subunit type 1 TsaB [Syntrophales bacterium]